MSTFAARPVARDTCGRVTAGRCLVAMAGYAHGRFRPERARPRLLDTPTNHHDLRNSFRLDPETKPARRAQMLREQGIVVLNYRPQQAAWQH